MTIAADIATPHVAVFCQEVVPGAAAVSVPCAPDQRALQMDCFETVDQRVREEGGSRVLGWAVWEVPGVLIEAEFHAVWSHPVNGALFDVAQRPMPFQSITFVADPTRQYEGRQVDNVRKPLKNDPLVKQFIYQAQRHFQLMNSGDLAHQHGAIAVPAHLFKDIERTRREMERLGKRIFKPGRSS